MKARKSLLVQILALAVAVAMSFVAWPFLPRTVPVHWGISGRPDAWGSPFFLLLLTPAVLAGMVYGTVRLVRGRSAPDAAVLAGMAVLGVWFVLEHGLLLGAMLRAFFPLRPLLALVFGLFLGLGPILARVEQNPWFGVRTPWTLGSKRVWRETHRATGRLWVVGGVVGSALTMFGAPMVLVLLFLVFMALTPVAISYGVWRKLGRP
ncbi:DUF1648 domain-containing protein [bacterium]|nr:MAG: DUF1648 domain-containing protein [bacterium]